LDVIIVDAFSWRAIRTSASSSPAWPGSFWGVGRGDARVAPDRLSIHAGASFDLPLGRAAAEQRLDHEAAMRFQDVHSVVAPRLRSGRSVRPAVQRPGLGAATQRPGGGVCPGHEWGILGGRRGHGEIVAELSLPREAPAARARGPAALASLARRGHVTLGSRQAAPVYQEFARALRKRTVAELLDAERGSR
jgi:hypothetical protein